MKKLSILAMAFLAVSCTSDYMDDFVVEYEENESVEFVAEQEKSEEYYIMLEFVETVCYYHDLFGVEMPQNPSYDDLMQISAAVIVTDTFADTLGEGECRTIYLLMLEYFYEQGNDDFVEYLKYILLRDYELNFYEEED